MEATITSHPRWKSLRLRDFFWLIFAIALALGTYRWGFQRGREYIEPDTIIAQVHTIPFQLDDQQSIDELLLLIDQTVYPYTWSNHGGNGSVEYFAANNSLVVSNSQKVQEAVAELLTELKKLEDPATTQVPMRVSDLLK